MSKENGWKEERAFYIEYGCIELTDERSGKQISDCNMIDADWSIPWLRFRTPPKIQALIEERDALKKENAELEQEFKELIIKLNYCSDKVFFWQNQVKGLEEENKQLQSNFIALEQAHENLIDGINNQKMLEIASKILKDNLIVGEEMSLKAGITSSKLPSGLTNNQLWKPLSAVQSLKIEYPALDQDHHLQSFINASNNPDFPKDPALGDIIYIINAGTISGVKVNEGDALYYTGTGATGWVLEQRGAR